MVKLAEYSRTATFAWSHDRIPSLVTGTASGTVDANFSSESTLELWSLLSADDSKPKAALNLDAKFNDLDWSHDDKIIAGALDNGTVELFSADNGSLKSETKFQHHTTSAKTVRFNAKQPNVLASGGTKGEIFIWDLNTCLRSPADYTPLTPGTAITPIDEVTSLAWNQSLAHVFASAGATSYASIWDLKAKKEVIHLSYSSPNTGFKAQLSVVEWHPANSTRVATATGSDNEPLVLVWDLRNANTPLQVLSQGHSKGILSLDWCHQDENLLLSSGRDNTIVLWNPESGDELTQFPTRGNWCFKTRFAPNAPDLFASASFDNKIQVQTLQNLVNTLDQEQSATKQQESESDFWNHVSQEDSNEKPTLLHVQAPAWYGNKSPAAQWAFGGKLVHITSDGKGVSISKPLLPGLEENKMLGEALKSNDYKPLINQRLAKTIDDVNEEDWNLLEKLSMDGKEDFLQEAFAFDDEEDKKENDLDDGENFFANIESAFEPQGTFTLSSDADKEVSKDLVTGNIKHAVANSLDKDLLLEALIIALDSDDKGLKDLVKGTYFAKYAKESSLSRFLYSISNRTANDLVENLDISQWKYAARAIYMFYADDMDEKNEKLETLGDKLIEAGNRQEALILYLAANSLDKVSSVWLSEFQSLEDKVQKQKGSLYEAHSECLSEFVERFTVFCKFVGEENKITNEQLISKFLEYVNLTSSSGSFDLAYALLETLPENNEDVKMEKQRVLFASGKSTKSTSSARKAGYGPTSGNNVGTGGRQSLGYSSIPPTNTAAPANPVAMAPFGAQQTLGLPNVQAATKINPYATLSTSMAGAATYAQAVSPGLVANDNFHASQSSFNPPANPYAFNASVPAVSTQPHYAPLNPKPVATFISSPQAFNGNDPTGVQAPRPVASGQTPYLNKKANDGWNDLPLNVKEKPSRAKAGTIAPISLGAHTPSTIGNAPTNSFASAPPPLSSKLSSRTPSLSSPLPPPPLKSSRLPSVSSNGSIPSSSPQATATNSYAPQAPTSIPSTPRMNYAVPAVPAAPLPISGANPYAPPTINPSPTSRPTNPYAPVSHQAPSLGGIPPAANPYANGSVSALPGAPPKAPVAPPPTNLRKVNHNTVKVENASHLLESVQKKSEAGSLNGQVQNGISNIPPPSMTAPVLSTAAAAQSNSPVAARGIPPDQKPIADFLKEELIRVTPLIPKEYAKQLKDCEKRLKILFQHMEKQDLLTQPTIDKLRRLVELLKEKKYADAMQVHVDISTNNAQEGGNWLTGVKRLIGIAEATST